MECSTLIECHDLNCIANEEDVSNESGYVDSHGSQYAQSTAEDANRILAGALRDQLSSFVKSSLLHQTPLDNSIQNRIKQENKQSIAITSILVSRLCDMPIVLPAGQAMLWILLEEPGVRVYSPRYCEWVDVSSVNLRQEGSKAYLVGLRRGVEGVALVRGLVEGVEVGLAVAADRVGRGLQLVLRREHEFQRTGLAGCVGRDVEVEHRADGGSHGAVEEVAVSLIGFGGVDVDDLVWELQELVSKIDARQSGEQPSWLSALAYRASESPW
ncbi:hypothetical protein KC360_g27 [Hortaea werneckii]|nr:hypothetical protein KC360_g27 [Hortaea werneckii]